MYSQPDLIYPGNQKGDFCLRQAIADYLHKYRAVRRTAAHIIVGEGIGILYTSDAADEQLRLVTGGRGVSKIKNESRTYMDQYGHKARDLIS